MLRTIILQNIFNIFWRKQNWFSVGRILDIAFNLTNKKKIMWQQIKFEAKCMAIIISNGVLFSETE